MIQENKITKEDQSTIDLSQAPLVEPDDGMFETYSNVVNLNWTLHDVRFRFAELKQQAKADSRGTWKDQEPVILERVAVTMPWYQAKYLHQMLGDLIRNYEELNGELRTIKLPAL
jgi:Protein of unknown function (DUF3467)